MGENSQHAATLIIRLHIKSMQCLPWLCIDVKCQNLLNMIRKCYKNVLLSGHAGLQRWSKSCRLRQHILSGALKCCLVRGRRGWTEKCKSSRMHGTAVLRRQHSSTLQRRASLGRGGFKVRRCGSAPGKCAVHFSTCAPNPSSSSSSPTD